MVPGRRTAGRASGLRLGRLRPGQALCRRLHRAAAQRQAGHHGEEPRRPGDPGRRRRAVDRPLPGRAAQGRLQAAALFPVHRQQHWRGLRHGLRPRQNPRRRLERQVDAKKQPRQGEEPLGDGIVHRLERPGRAAGLRHGGQGDRAAHLPQLEEPLEPEHVVPARRGLRRPRRLPAAKNRLRRPGGAAGKPGRHLQRQVRAGPPVDQPLAQGHRLRPGFEREPHGHAHHQQQAVREPRARGKQTACPTASPRRFPPQGVPLPHAPGRLPGRGAVLLLHRGHVELPSHWLAGRGLGPGRRAAVRLLPLQQTPAPPARPGVGAQRQPRRQLARHGRGQGRETPAGQDLQARGQGHPGVRPGRPRLPRRRPATQGRAPAGGQARQDLGAQLRARPFRLGARDARDQRQGLSPVHPRQGRRQHRGRGAAPITRSAGSACRSGSSPKATTSSRPAA